MRETQEAQVIPTTGTESSARGAGEVLIGELRILQGSIQTLNGPGRPRPARHATLTPP